MSQSLLTTDVRSSTERYYWVDVLRGFAAVIVLVSHVSIFGLYGHEHVLAKTPPTRLLWAGHQAVILFFVVSGFALFLLFESMVAKRHAWLRFIEVRVLRLYPPYAASLVLALVVLYAPPLFNTLPPDGAPTIARGVISARELFYHFTLIGNFNVLQLNPPIWSLVLEMRLSLLYPLIYFTAARGGWKGASIATAIYIGAVALVAGFEYGYLQKNPVFEAALRTDRFGMFFLIGAWIGKHRFYVIERISTLHTRAKVLVLIISLFAFMYSYGYDWPGWAPWWVLSVAEMVTALASAYFLALAISFRTSFRSASLTFLGRLSYSLYLTHQIVVMGVILFFYGKFPADKLWIISIAASLIVAQLFYVIVEAPSIAMSRRRRGVGNAVST